MYARDYGKGPSWLPGTVTATIGSAMYEVLLDGGSKVRKHIEQLRSRLSADSDHMSDLKPRSEEDDFDIVGPNREPVEEQRSGDQEAVTAHNADPPGSGVLNGRLSRHRPTLLFNLILYIITYLPTPQFNFA